MKYLVLSLLSLTLIGSMAQAAVSPTSRASAFSGGGNAPEPASMALLAMGAAAIGRKIHKNRKNKKKDSDQA